MGYDRPVPFSAGPVDGAVHAHVAAGSGKRRTEEAAECLASQDEGTAQTDKLGPLVFCYSLSPVTIDTRRHTDHPTRDPGPMASLRFPVLLALEVAPSRQPSENRRRITRAFQAYD